MTDVVTGKLDVRGAVLPDTKGAEALESLSSETEDDGDDELGP